MPPLPDPRLRVLAITDRRLAGGDAALLARCRDLIELGVRAFMLREKDLNARELLVLADRLRAMTAESDALLIVNDRLDVALSCGADGVHLPASSLPPDRARRTVPDPHFLIGVSCHTQGELARAGENGASYALLSPMFAPISKEIEYPVLPLEELSTAVSDGAPPVLALGGITPKRAAEVLAAGAAGIAGIGAFFDPEAAFEAWADVIEDTR